MIGKTNANNGGEFEVANGVLANVRTGDSVRKHSFIKLLPPPPSIEYSDRLKAFSESERYALKRVPDTDDFVGIVVERYYNYGYSDLGDKCSTTDNEMFYLRKNSEGAYDKISMKLATSGGTFDFIFPLSSEKLLLISGVKGGSTGSGGIYFYNWALHATLITMAFNGTSYVQQAMTPDIIIEPMSKAHDSTPDPYNVSLAKLNEKHVCLSAAIPNADSNPSNRYKLFCIDISDPSKLSVTCTAETNQYIDLDETRLMSKVVLDGDFLHVAHWSDGIYNDKNTKENMGYYYRKIQNVNGLAFVVFPAVLLAVTDASLYYKSVIDLIKTRKGNLKCAVGIDETVPKIKIFELSDIEAPIPNVECGVSETIPEVWLYGEGTKVAGTNAVENFRKIKSIAGGFVDPDGHHLFGFVGSDELNIGVKFIGHICIATYGSKTLFRCAVSDFAPPYPNTPSRWELMRLGNSIVTEPNGQKRWIGMIKNNDYHMLIIPIDQLEATVKEVGAGDIIDGVSVGNSSSADRRIDAYI